MNEYTLNDPQLQSLEARLAALVPGVSPAERQQLLYQSAFAAGKQASRRSLRRWQAVAAALGVLAAVLSVPRAQDDVQDVQAVEQKLEPPAAPELVRQHTDAEVEIPAIERPQVAVELDAWQVGPSDHAALAEQLAQFNQIEPHLRSLAVGRLTRAYLQP